VAKSDGPGRADIQAVSRTSQILGLFNVDQTELVTADVAIALGLNRTTTHRYLTSMTAVGLLEPGSRHSSYVMGPLTTKLGAIATGAAPVLEVAPPHMLELSDTLGTTVALSLWASTGPMIVHVAEPRIAEAVLTLRVGTVMSIDAAQGVLFAAFLPPESSHIDAQRARLTPAARADFDARVDQVRESGLAVAHREDVGVVAVAAPVFDAQGICATVAAVGLEGTITEQAIREHSAHVKELAATLTGSVGGRLPEHLLQ
jgi:DNA-binding IclR family transcriptional regulator